MAEIEHNGWTLIEDEDQDSDGFWAPMFWAERGDEKKLLNCSRFNFTATQERFAFLVDNGFPSHPPRPDGKPYPLGPWTDEAVDAAIREAEENQS